MAKLFVIVSVLATVLLMQSEAYKMSRCELVHQLRRHGFPEYEMSNWVCLVESESGRRTHVIGPINTDGSHDYGLFQINDRYWCSNTNEPGKECGITCKSLLTDDIGTASACTKLIYSRMGFSAWYGWQRHCRGALPDISYC